MLSHARVVVIGVCSDLLLHSKLQWLRLLFFLRQWFVVVDLLLNVIPIVLWGSCLFVLLLYVPSQQL